LNADRALQLKRNVGLQEALRKMANEEADQNLIRVKADATGVDVAPRLG
jgi:hypothetical protein